MRRFGGLLMFLVLAMGLAVPMVALAQVSTLPPEGELVRVVEVIDGDTIRVQRANGDIERVRYIGIDAPELTDEDEEGPEPYSRQASLANAAFVEGKDVLLERDTSDRDKFDRLLRYVWVDTGDGWVMVNDELAALGLADVRSYEPDTRRAGELLEAKDQAVQTGRGMYDPVAVTRGLVGAEAMAYLFADAYEARDVPMLRRLMHRNVVYITPDGERFSGKAAVMARFREEWAVLDPSVTIKRTIAQPQVVLVDLTINIATTEGPPTSSPSPGIAPIGVAGETIDATALQRWPGDRLRLFRLYRDD